MVMGLYSCSQDADLTPVSQVENDVVTVKHTVTVTRGNVETRVSVSEDEGSLVRGWEDNDQLLVTTADGNKLGVMNVEDKEKGVFSGDLILPRNFTEGTVNYIYLGSGVNAEAAASSTGDASEVYNFKPVASVEDLAAYDILSASASATVDKGILVKESGETMLNSLVSFGHFALQFPEGVEYNNEGVSISGNTFYNSAQVSFKDGSLVEKSASEVKYNAADMYLTLVPTSNFEANFTVTIDGIDWLGTISRNEVTGGAYYRKNVEGENNAVNVVMQRAFTITYDINGGAATNFPEPATSTKSGTDKVTFDNLPVLTPSDATFYEFKGWSLDKDATEGASSIEVTENETVYAIWAKKNVTLTLEGYDNDGTTYLGITTEGTRDIDNLTMYTSNLDEPSKDGYEFKGWSATPLEAYDKDATIAEDILVEKVVFTAEEVRGGTTTKKVYAVWQKLQSTGNFELPGASGTDW